MRCIQYCEQYMINKFFAKIFLYILKLNLFKFFYEVKNDVPIFLFAFFSLFCFYPFFQIKGHEIFPYYFICIFFINWKLYNKVILAIYFLLFLLFFCLFIALQNLNFLTLLEIFIPIYTLISFNNLAKSRQILFAKCLLFFVFLVLLLLTYQFFVPESIDYIYNNLLVRKVSYLNLHGRILGIAPEPAYMASWLLGALILI